MTFITEFLFFFLQKNRLLTGRVQQDYCLHVFADTTFAFSWVRKDEREQEGFAEGQETHYAISGAEHLIGVLLAQCQP